MTVPQVRVNIQAPFPAFVRPSGPITITKQNGVWTIGYNVLGLPTLVPPPSGFPDEWVMAFNNGAGQTFSISLADLANQIATEIRAGAVAQRLIAGSYAIVQGDAIINMNINQPNQVVTLPPAASWAGQPLMFKDVGPHCTQFPVTLQPAADEPIDGQPNYQVDVDYGYLRLVPANDGTTPPQWFIS